MKIIHCADIHLGSKIESHFSSEISDERKRDIRSAFEKMIKYAKKYEIGVVILAGDIFDSDTPIRKDKEYFYGAIKNNPDIDFLYLRGNHDVNETYQEEKLENLKMFSDTWTSYRYDDVVITGIEYSKRGLKIDYASLNLDATKKNIVVLHGQVTDAQGEYYIDLTKLIDKHIDYLALGHIHKGLQGKLDSRGVYVYPGCLEGRGFDECDEKGFYVIDTGKTLSYQFVKNSLKVIHNIEIDISSADSLYVASRLVSEAIEAYKNDIVKVTLFGDIGFDNSGLDKEIESNLASSFYFIYVKDMTTERIDIEKIKDETSLKGEFIRTVLANKEYSDEEKSEIINCGLKAISGREVK